MKKRFIFIVFLFILFFNIKVEALSSVSLSVSRTPEETVAGQFFTLAINATGKQSSFSKLIFTFTYDDEYVQLVGFEKGNDTSCSFTGNEITCSTEGSNLVYPVFRIKKDFTSNQTINVVGRESVEAPSSNAKVTVSKKEKVIVVTSIEIEDYKNTLSIGETAQLEVTVYPDNAKDKKVTFTSDDNDIVMVSDTGLVSATGEGEGTITIKCGDIEKTARFTVMKDPIELKEIKVKEKTITLTEGDKKKLVYTLDPEDATVKEEDIIVKSLDEEVVVIDNDLNIHAMGEGTTKITISAGLIKTEIEVTVEAKNIPVKKSSALVPCIVTAIVTFVLTVLIMFLMKFKKNNSDDGNSSPSVNSNGDFNFDM